MSQFQCAVDGTRIAGAASTVHAWLGRGIFATRKRSNYCAVHIDDQVGRILAKTDLVWIGDAPQLEVDDFPRVCTLCKNTEDLYTCFIDVFARGSEPRAFRARWCEEHVDEAASVVRITL